MLEGHPYLLENQQVLIYEQLKLIKQSLVRDKAATVCCSLVYLVSLLSVLHSAQFALLFFLFF